MHQILGQCLEKSGLAGSILDQLHRDLFQDLEAMAWTGLNLEFEGHLLEILEGAK
jgi:fido (protein-threonine AMPylation protein)